ncbi:hypothetical protein WG68_05945 [Arsukibacterium ikkense]|uniref:Multidrug transporter n=1 Tax=Arsukibacterium ikkense TaxID=336831 RepID=A0A0M2V6Q5_9GAMM|nr:SapC family protein [Arsukibacterium ikkense]KKO46311.1 hypothetical protein WG68_05945 [Arsukibacterium ikkense]
MTAIRPLTKEAHGHLRLSSDPDVSHVAAQQLLQLQATEFVSAAGEYPIVFVKNSHNGQFQAVLLLALTEGCNEFVRDKSWQGRYLPQVLRYYPLCLAPDPDNTSQLLVAVHESSARLNSQQGQPLFNPDGTESAVLADYKQGLAGYFQAQQLTEVFVARLAELALLVPQQLSVQLHGQQQQLNGLYVVDEAKLNTLASEDFAELRQRGFLPAIYAQLLSLQRLRHLVSRAASAVD